MDKLMTTVWCIQVSPISDRVFAIFFWTLLRSLWLLFARIQLVDFLDGTDFVFGNIEVLSLELGSKWICIGKLSDSFNP